MVVDGTTLERKYILATIVYSLCKNVGARDSLEGLPYINCSTILIPIIISKIPMQLLLNPCCYSMTMLQMIQNGPFGINFKRSTIRLH